MAKVILIIVAAVLVLHGLIHLMGTATYLQLTDVQGLPYKTTLLGGRWDLGESGIALFGALWVIAAVGFVLAGLAFGFSWSWWQLALLAVALFSLVLTGLDWTVAYAGLVINVVILLLLWLGPRFDLHVSR